MANIIRLGAESGYLSFDVADDGSCQCAYEADTRLVLGTEDRSYIFPKLSKAVAVNLEAAGLGQTYQVFGHNAYYVLMLQERRYALYATESNGYRLLLWVDAHADPPKLAAQLALNENQRQEWFNRLVCLVETRPNPEEGSYQ